MYNFEKLKQIAYDSQENFDTGIETNALCQTRSNIHPSNKKRTLYNSSKMHRALRFDITTITRIPLQIEGT